MSNFRLKLFCVHLPNILKCLLEFDMFGRRTTILKFHHINAYFAENGNIPFLAYFPCIMERYFLIASHIDFVGVFLLFCNTQLLMA